MPVHGSHFCESGTIESEAPSPIHFMDFQHQNHWQWCQNDHPGVGDLPNEDLQAVGCPLLSRPCCGVILESIHPLRWWWGIPTSTWELSRSAYFRWQTWSPPIGSSPRPPESLEPQVEDDIKPEAWGGFLGGWWPIECQIDCSPEFRGCTHTSSLPRGFWNLGFHLSLNCLISAGEPTSSLRFLQVENTPR